MSNIFKDLLAMDQLAQKTGAGLNPRLREAIEADLHFHTRRAGPDPEVAPEDLPEEVSVFPKAPEKTKKQA
ncbi:hypothetical protein QTO30_04085 [Yoonia sp. GPGPB17]|uniref:hypothetical protein n=1 Tax=Yoonia sp. GPGPB17 TaxID=3026147 RepID=UPI0030C00989